MEWCKENNCRGNLALKTGVFPLVKDRQTINRRLDGKVQTGSERAYCNILTADEELPVVNYAKNMDLLISSE